MAPADWRLISMWEGEPVGVDPRRPLLGFVLVAVLCAVLMTISVGRGFGVDLVHPGKPIATPPVRTPVEPPADVVVVPASVTLPDGLSADPYAVVASGGPVPASASEESASESTATESTPDTTVDTEATTSSPRVERKAHRAATKAERKADKAAAKAERKADKAAAKAGRKADKAAAKAARDAAKAARKG